VFGDRQRVVAARRTRPSACDTLSRSCARHVLCWLAFLPVPALRSTGSATSCPALFAGFVAPMAKSDVSRSCITGFDSSSSRCGPAALRCWPNPRSPDSRTKSVHTCQGLRPRRVGRALALTHPSMLPSVLLNTSAPRLLRVFAAPWLACALPCRRFACTLASADARLGADADRYAFTVGDFHLLLFAGFDRRTRSRRDSNTAP
jgi:hypothetical protein